MKVSLFLTSQTRAVAVARFVVCLGKHIIPNRWILQMEWLSCVWKDLGLSSCENSFGYFDGPFRSALGHCFISNSRYWCKIRLIQSTVLRWRDALLVTATAQAPSMLLGSRELDACPCRKRSALSPKNWSQSKSSNVETGLAAAVY